LNYFDLVSPTYIENWPSQMYSLSIAGRGIRMTTEQVVALGQTNVEYGESFGLAVDSIASVPAITRNRVKILEGLEEQIDLVAYEFPTAFVRLGSRSPKDAWSFHKTRGKVFDGEQAIKLLTDCSERVSDDLLLALQNAYDPWIWLRQWVEIEPWSEFRCLIKDRHLVGISQYDYRTHHDQVDRHAESFAHWIRQWIEQTFMPVSHLDSVVADVYVRMRSHKSELGPIEREFQVKLLEINPYCAMTDPCLFDWKNDPDRTFRWRGADKSVKAVALGGC
jgi:hypothetical protein